MKRNKTAKLETKNIIRVAVITLLILSIPFMAMQFDWRVVDPGSPGLERVNWNTFDFLVMGILLFSVGLSYELLAKKVPTNTERLVVAMILAGIFFLLWAELAVGIFGSPIAGS